MDGKMFQEEEILKMRADQSLGKLKDDRFPEMSRRSDEDENKSMPGRLRNPFGQNGGGDDISRKPGKLKNRFGGVKPKGDDGLNHYPGTKRRKGKDKATLDDKKKRRKKKSIEIYDKDGNKYKGA